MDFGFEGDVAGEGDNFGRGEIVLEGEDLVFAFGEAGGEVKEGEAFEAVFEESARGGEG